MINNDIQKVKSFAHRVLYKYFCESDVYPLISAFAPEIIWLGAGELQKAEGAEAVSKHFLAGIGDLVPCRMWDETYEVLPLGDNHILCEGQSWIESKDTTKTLKVFQRITFIFKPYGDTFQIVHIHNSVPFSAIQPDELFPIQAAKDAYEQMKNALTKKDRQIDLMLSQLPGGMEICSIDENFTTKWVSQSLCSMLEFTSPEEYSNITKNIALNYILPEDYEQAYHTIYQRFQDGHDDYTVEYRIKTKSGKIKWVSDLGKKLIDTDNNEVIYCFISDISERKQQEESIQKANLDVKRQAESLTQLFNTVPCGIMQFTFAMGEEPKIININRMAGEIYGFTNEDLFTITNPMQLVLEKDVKGIKQLINKLTLTSGKISYIREGIRKDGSQCWVNVVMERLINANGIDVIQAMFTDITETKQLQEEQEQEQLIENRSLRTAIKTAYPLIMNVNLTQNTYHCFSDENFDVSWPNEGYYDELIENTTLITYSTYQVDFKETFNRQNIINKYQSGNPEIYMEFKQMGVDQKYHWLSAHFIHVDNPYNDDILAIGLIKILDQQRTEKAMQEQVLRDALASAKAANNAKSDFLSRMSHDIRTPMNAIIGMSTIGQLKIDNISRVKDCFHKIDSSSRYLLSLINDILDMSRIERGKMTISHIKFDFTELADEIKNIIYPQAIARKITFEMYHQEPIEKFYIGDSLRLKQIIMNLMSNALKFTPIGGKVFLKIREAKRSNGFAFLEISVEDTGIGISEEFLKKLYQPFEQETSDVARNNIGSGLGLSIVYNLVQLMGGTLDTQSEKNKGTTFTVSVPFELVQDNKEKEQLRKSKELLNGLQVLIVDDDEIVGEQTSAILSNIGAESIWVDSGKKAIAEIKKSIHMEHYFDIAMIDWLMPDMNGLETARQIRKLVGPDTTIIIISAYDWSSIEEEAKAVGVNCFISKPLFQSTIYDTLLHLDINRHEPKKTKQIYHFKGKRVLLVEDNELNLEIAKSLLEIHDMEVDTAENGQIAVDKFKESPLDYYLAILMDIRMPVMDGLTATREIRRLEREDAQTIPIIAMTANAFDEDRNVALDIGMDGYLVKPIDITVLIETLEKYNTIPE